MSLFGCCECSGLKSDIKKLEREVKLQQNYSEELGHKLKMKEMDLQQERSKDCKLHGVVIGPWYKYSEQKPEPGHKYLIWTQYSYEGFMDAPKLRLATFCCLEGFYEDWYAVNKEKDRFHYKNVVYWSKLPQFPGDK